MSKKKGFTLIEILLVFALIAILGTAAVSNYLSTTRTFSFLNKYKEVVAAVRNVRTFAVANKQLEPGMTRYGIKIDEKNILVFDDANTPYTKDEGAKTDKEFLNESIKLADTDYKIATGTSSGVLAMPVYVFYENSTGEVKIFETVSEVGLVELKKDTTKCIYLKFYNAGDQRFIDINNISGLIESFNENKCK